jgi:hypothetical protein
MRPKIFQINTQNYISLKSNGTSYFVREYLDEYNEQLSAWKIKCISIYNYWQNEMHGNKVKEEIFYESEFIEFDRYFNFNPPTRKPSETTKKLNNRIESLLYAPDKLDALLNKGYNWHRGVYKEELLKKLIIDLLAKDLSIDSKIKVGTGFIMKNPRIHSRQLDIIVYVDSDEVLFNCENFVIVPHKSTIATIEIKSKLDKTQMLGYGNNIGALRNQYDLADFENTTNGNIIKCIIGYKKGFKKTGTFHEWISSFYKGELIDKKNLFITVPTLIGTLDGFCALFGLDKGTPSVFYSKSPEGISSFQVFYSELLKGINKMLHISIPSSREYLNMLPDEEYRSDNPLGINWKGVGI